MHGSLGPARGRHPRRPQARPGGALLPGRHLPLVASGRGHARRARPVPGHVAPERLSRPEGARRGAGDPGLGRGRPVGADPGCAAPGLPPDPGRGDGRLPRRTTDGQVRRRLRPRACRGLPEARRGPPGGAGPPRPPDARRHGPSAPRPGGHAAPPRAHPGLGRAAGGGADLRHQHLRPGARRTRRTGAPVADRAVHGDARPVPDRMGRDPRGRADVQARADPPADAHDGDLRGPARRGHRGGPRASLGDHLRPGAHGGAPPLRAGGRRPGRRDHVAPDPGCRAGGGRRAALAGHRLGHDRDPELDPLLGPRRRGRSRRPSCGRRSRTSSPRPPATTADLAATAPIHESVRGRAR